MTEQRFERASLLALKMEEGTMNQGMQVACKLDEAEKKKRRDSTLEFPEEMQAC